MFGVPKNLFSALAALTQRKYLSEKIVLFSPVRLYIFISFITFYFDCYLFQMSKTL
jgi:hypothetical protein